MVPPGEARTTILDMAREWEHLAEQQGHATGSAQEGIGRRSRRPRSKAIACTGEDGALAVWYFSASLP